MNHYVIAYAGLIAILSAVPVSAADEAKSEMSQNAALQYWLAMAVIPEYSDEQAEVIADWHTTPLNDQVKAIVKGMAPALRLMHRGASMQGCDWGLNYLEDGPATLLPHISKCRQLARLAALRARLRFSTGDINGAVDDLVATMAMGRHLAGDPVSITQLVHYAIESMAIECLADHFDLLDEAALKALDDRLGKLPPAPPFAASIMGEKRFFVGWAQRQIATGNAAAVTGSLELMGPAGHGAAASTEKLTESLKELAEHYDELAELCKLPLAQFAKASKAFEQKVATSPNVWVRMMMPAVGHARRHAAAADVRLAMLKAAIVYRLKGKAAFEAIEQVHGKGPFKLTGNQARFTLESVVKVRGKPVRMDFGTKAEPETVEPDPEL